MEFMPPLIDLAALFFLFDGSVTDIYYFYPPSSFI